MTPSSAESIFELTSRILNETEIRLLGSGPTNAFWGTVRKSLHSFRFMRIGMAELFRPAFQWSVISAVGFAVASFWIFRAYPNLTVDIKSDIILFFTLVAMFMVTFAVPSAFVFDSIKGEELQELADYIHGQGIDSEEKVKLLQDNLEMVSSRVLARTKSLEWMVGTAWALLLLGAGQVSSILMKCSPGEFMKSLPYGIAVAFGFVIAYLVILLVISGHKKGMGAVLNRIQFAAQELKYRYLLAEPDASVNEDA